MASSSGTRATEIDMPNRPRRGLLAVRLGGGLLALALLWLPFETVEMSFSGPTRDTTHVGLLSSVEVTTRYAPSRLGTFLGSRAIEPPSLKPGEVIWDHHGKFGADVVILRVEEKSVNVNGLTLAASLLGTLLVLWFGMIRPSRKLIQSLRGSKELPLPKACEFSSAP